MSSINVNNPAEARRFILDNTRRQEVPLLPEIELMLAHEMLPLWQLTEEQLTETGLPPPYWAFAWAGGQALARYVLDHPECVSGRRVLDFATGSGVVGIAASLCKAASVLCVDLDPLARTACELNASANGARVQVSADRWPAHGVRPGDVVLAGDVFYEQPMSDEVRDWLRQCVAQGADVFVGDPGRSYLPETELTLLQTYHVETTRELEDSDLRRTRVFEFRGCATPQNCP